MANMTIPTSRDIYLELNGRKLAVVQGYNARAGKAKITIANGSGKTHPWHLIHTDSSSNVYGWVDDGTFD